MRKLFMIGLLIIPFLSQAQQAYYGVTPGDGYGLRFWNDDAYKIHMGYGAEYFFGPVTGYSIKNNMSGGTPDRGWTWGVAGQTPVAAINTQGHMRIAGDFTALGNLYFSQSGNAPDGYPYARFREQWGIRFNSPDSRWVLSSKPSVLIGYQPGGQDWGNDNLYVSGKVGIGTSSPNSTLSVQGRLGIRNDAPPTAASEVLRVEGAITADENVANFTNLSDQDFIIRLSGVGATTKRTIIGPSVSNRFSLGVGASAGNEHLTIISGGNVGIGTTTPDSKLTVKGTIHTQEVKVDLNGSVAPDYVFEKDYALTSLEELKSYIDQNKHLPEVPSAKEMEEEGINLKEMNLLLLKKVEELTLYQIESTDRIKSLENEILKLKQK